MHYIAFHVLSNIFCEQSSESGTFTRYYWKKSTTFQGIRLIKVSRKWSQISHVDAAAEVPFKDMVYFFEGDFPTINLKA